MAAGILFRAHNETQQYLRRVHIIPAAISARRIQLKTQEDRSPHAPDSDSRIPLGKSRRMDPAAHEIAPHAHVRACMCTTSATFCARVTPCSLARAPAPPKHLLAAIKTPHERQFSFPQERLTPFRRKMGKNGRACVRGHSNFPSAALFCGPQELQPDFDWTLEKFLGYSPFLINFWKVVLNFLPMCCLPLFIFHSSSSIL